MIGFPSKWAIAEFSDACLVAKTRRSRGSAAPFSPDLKIARSPRAPRQGFGRAEQAPSRPSPSQRQQQPCGAA